MGAEVLSNIYKDQKREFLRPVFPGEIVAIVLQDNRGRVLLVLENQPNKEHGREPNEWGVPTETCTKDDGNFYQAAWATLIEEVTGKTDIVFAEESYRCDILPYKRDPSRFYKRHSCVMRIQGEHCALPLSPIDPDEIVDYYWFSPDDLPQLSSNDLKFLLLDGNPLSVEALRLIKRYQKQGFLDPIES